LFPVAKVIEVEAFSLDNWNLAFSSRNPDLPTEMRTRLQKYIPKNGEEAMADLDKYIDEKPGADWGTNLVAEHTMISKNQSSFEALVKVSLKPLLYTESPIRLASHDGSLTLILSSMGSENIYNTLRLEAKERAGKEIQETVLPEIKQFQVINIPAIKYFGVIDIYGTKDFSEPDSTPKPELVALVASVQNCRKLANAEMTEEDFVAASDVYIVGKIAIDQVRKVKVSLGKE
jgi:hypothetical protein